MTAIYSTSAVPTVGFRTSGTRMVSSAAVVAEHARIRKPRWPFRAHEVLQLVQAPGDGGCLSIPWDMWIGSPAAPCTPSSSSLCAPARMNKTGLRWNESDCIGIDQLLNQTNLDLFESGQAEWLQEAALFHGGTCLLIAEAEDGG